MMTFSDNTSAIGALEKPDERSPSLSSGNLQGDHVDTTLRFVRTRTNIDVKLSNKNPVSALRFEIAFERGFKYRPPELHNRVQELNSYLNFQDGTLTAVLLDINERGIQPGEGTIISIPFDPDLEFEVLSVYASSGTGGIAELDYAISAEDSEDSSLVLEQNDPNPFSNTTKIEFRIADQSNVKLTIYDFGGALIHTLVDSKLEEGVYAVEWDGKDDSGKQVESGIYLYKLYAGIYSLTRKMVFLK